jgi:hypothetical protein
MTNDQVSSLCFVLAGGAVIAGAVGLHVGSISSPDSGFMPFLAGAGMCLFGGIGFVGASLRRGRGERWRPVFRTVRWPSALMTLAALAAYAAGLKPVGFIPCTALLMAFLLRGIIPQRWPVVLAGTLGATGGAYLLFEVWLKAQLPRGLLGF